MKTDCLHAVTLETLIDYFSAELSPSDSDELEEHLFACAACGHRLEMIAGLGAGVRRLVRQGAVPFVLTDALWAQLTADGVRTREFRLEPGGATPCGAAREDELVVVHLVAELAGVARASLRLTLDAGALDLHHQDIPLDAGRKAVRIAYPGHLIRALPDGVGHVVLATEAEGQERLTHYTLLHSHAGPPPEQ